MTRSRSQLWLTLSPSAGIQLPPFPVSPLKTLKGLHIPQVQSHVLFPEAWSPGLSHNSKCHHCPCPHLPLPPTPNSSPPPQQTLGLQASLHHLSPAAGPRSLAGVRRDLPTGCPIQSCPLRISSPGNSRHDPSQGNSDQATAFLRALCWIPTMALRLKDRSL